MASQAGFFTLQEFTDAGALMIGGRLYTYAAGTTTFKTAYTDAAGAVPHTYTADGLGGSYIALNARGEIPAPLYLATGSYDIALKRADGSPAWTRQADPAADLGDALSGKLASTGNAALGAALVGFNPTLSYPAQTIGRFAADREWNPKDAPWLAKFDNATDDTAAIVACFNALAAAGGGTMLLPRGKAVCNNAVLVFPSNTVTVNIRGHGKNATVLRKTTADINPVISLVSSSATVPASIESEFADWSVVGNASAGPGIRTTLIARFVMRNLGAQLSSIGHDNAGSLIFDTHNCDWLSNATHYKSRKSGVVRCNAINIYGGTFADATGYGFDIGDSSEFFVHGSDIERCGTAGNTASGDVIIRDTVDDETTNSIIGFYGTHHEANAGKGFTTEAATGLLLILKGVRLDNNSSGTDLNIGAISTFSWDHCIANSTVNIASTVSNLIGGSFVTLNDSAVYKNYSNVSSAAGLTLSRVTAGALGGVTIDNIGNVSVGAAGLSSAGDITVKGGNSLLTTTVALVSGAAGNTATMTNGPRTGNPLKWVQINDAGTTRFIPTW